MTDSPTTRLDNRAAEVVDQEFATSTFRLFDTNDNGELRHGWQSHSCAT
jgi:hypothetical protein